MRFREPLIPAVLVRRYQRFLADVTLGDGRLLTVHCPNSGSMRGCSKPGSPVMLSLSPNPGRKYPHTLELVRAGSFWVGVNTNRTNHLVHEAVEAGVIREFGTVDGISAEVKTSPHTRLDFLLHQGERSLYLEVKNCTLAENGTAMFPDAVTSRGTKHLRELLSLRKAGHQAAVLFCVQRQDAHRFSPAGHIDPLYATTLAEAGHAGVLVLAYRAEVSPDGVDITTALPVELDAGPIV